MAEHPLYRLFRGIIAVALAFALVPSLGVAAASAAQKVAPDPLDSRATSYLGNITAPGTGGNDSCDDRAANSQPIPEHALAYTGGTTNDTMLTITGLSPGWALVGIAVKGGDGYNWYGAGPWIDLHAPEAGQSKQPAKISHWVACGSFTAPADKIVTPEQPWIEPDIVCDAKTVAVNIPSMTGVVYRVGGVDVSGSHVVNVDADGKYAVTVTAEAAGGFTFSVNAKAAWDITGQVPACPPATTKATPLAPALVGPVACGVSSVNVSIPSTPGVLYKVGGQRVTDPVNVPVVNGDYSVTITAEPVTGYEFTNGADTRWTIIGQVDKCPPIPPVDPQVGPLTVSFTQQCVITGGIDITAEVSNPNASGATATFHGQSMVVPAHGKASVKAHVASKTRVDVVVAGAAIDGVTAIDDLCAVAVEGVKITAGPTPAPSQATTTAVAVKGVKLADTGANFPLGSAVLLAALLLGGGAFLLAMPKLGMQRRRRH